MDKIQAEFLRDEMHAHSNMFVLLVICHGLANGDLLDREQKPVWNTEDLQSKLSAVKSLQKRPKVLIIQACRGGEDAGGVRGRGLCVCGGGGCGGGVVGVVRGWLDGYVCACVCFRSCSKTRVKC